MEDNNINDQRSENRSRISLDSIQEISYRKEVYIRFSLILINIASLIIGIYILKNSEYFLNPDYKFTNYRSLYFFIITYSLGMISALFLSFLIALIVKLINFLKNKKENIDNSTVAESTDKNLINLEQEHTRISVFILNNKQNEIALIPFTLSYFIAITIGLYFIALPYSFCLIINLLKNEVYSKFTSFFWLYIFLIINFIAGLILILSLFYMVFAKRSGSVRKLEYKLDNENVEKIKKEVRDAIKI